MARGWDDIEELLVTLAREDLDGGGELQPALAAFTGDTLACLAFLRPFEKGGYADPVIELLALALPLGCDRLGLSLGGRVWSLADPIPPVSDEVDLRQRAVVIHLVDGTSEPVADSVVHPFTLDGGTVEWGPVVRELGEAVGWIPEVLRLAVERGRELAASDDEIRRQAQRCDALGHEVHLGFEVAQRLLSPRCASRPGRR